MQLRDYQTAAVNVLWNALAGAKNTEPALCVLPTASGKSQIMFHMAKRVLERIAPDESIAIVTGRDKLIGQIARDMRKIIPDTTVWSAGQGEKMISRSNVVSIHSADNLTIPKLRLIIVDEAHGINEGRYLRFLNRHEPAKLLGFTATPWRSGVEIFGEGRIFPRVNYRRGLKELIDQGYLVRPVMKSMALAFNTAGVKIDGDDFQLTDLLRITEDAGKIAAQVADAIPRLEGRHKIVWICTSIKHAEMVASELAKHGESVAVVHSKNPANDYALECFHAGPVRHMASVMMLTEGYDFPAIDAVVMCRPTRSPTLYVQCIGRALRLSPGKSDALILDYGRVVENCGPLHDPVTREMRKKNEKEKVVSSIKTCPTCLSFVDRAAVECPDCNHEFAPPERDPLKSLTVRAADVDLLADRKITWNVAKVTIERSLTKKGEKCIILSFYVEGRMWPIKMWGMNSPWSWRKFQETLDELTPFDFDSWSECYDNCHVLTLDTPRSITTKEKNGFPTITGITRRTPDP